MVAFSPDVQAQLAVVVPWGDVTALPARYSKLSKKQRVAVREAYIERQNGLCSHCGHPLHEQPPFSITDKIIRWEAFPGGRAGFLRYPVHLHHNHHTDFTIGAVHSYCNAVLFQYYGE